MQAMEVGQDTESDPLQLQGMRSLKRAFQLFDKWVPAGWERDNAWNRKLLFSPTLQSVRSLVAVSGLRRVQQLLGGVRVPQAPRLRRGIVPPRSCC
jgi:hypothetical protein